MDDKSTIKDLERQAANTKRLVDRINIAYYGMTWDEYVLTLAKISEKSKEEDEEK